MKITKTHLLDLTTKVIAELSESSFSGQVGADLLLWFEEWMGDGAVQTMRINSYSNNFGHEEVGLGINYIETEV